MHVIAISGIVVFTMTLEMRGDHALADTVST